MPAAVESMAYFGSTPWHREGTPADEDCRFDSLKFGEKADILWDAHKEPLVTVPQAQAAVDYAMSCGDDDDTPTVSPNTSHYAVVRDKDKKVLGVVGPRYRILQNRDALTWFDPWLESQTLQMHTGGSLLGGQKIWVLAQVCQETYASVTPGDDIAKFVLLSNSHDGTTSVRVGFTPIRVVCANTLAMAHSAKASKLMRIRHSSQLKTNMDTIRDTMDAINQEFKATVEQFQFLAGRHVNTSDLRKYVKICLDIPVDKVHEDLPTKTKNIVRSVEQLMDDPRQRVGQSAGTWWAAYNAVNQYLNYEQGRNVSNRLNSLWYGQAANLNNKALEQAVEMAA